MTLRTLATHAATALVGLLAALALVLASSAYAQTGESSDTRAKPPPVDPAPSTDTVVCTVTLAEHAHDDLAASTHAHDDLAASTHTHTHDHAGVYAQDSSTRANFTTAFALIDLKASKTHAHEDVAADDHTHDVAHEHDYGHEHDHLPDFTGVTLSGSDDAWRAWTAVQGQHVAAGTYSFTATATQKATGSDGQFKLHLQTHGAARTHTVALIGRTGIGADTAATATFDVVVHPASRNPQGGRLYEGEIRVWAEAENVDWTFSITPPATE